MRMVRGRSPLGALITGWLAADPLKLAVDGEEGPLEVDLVGREPRRGTLRA
jgi:hypothetical protein